MLSRIADSMFWMSRYMARAEDTARLLDVTYHMLLEQSQDSYQLRWDGIITITGEQELFYQFYVIAHGIESGFPFKTGPGIIFRFSYKIERVGRRLYIYIAFAALFIKGV